MIMRIQVQFALKIINDDTAAARLSRRNGKLSAGTGSTKSESPPEEKFKGEFKCANGKGTQVKTTRSLSSIFTQILYVHRDNYI